MRHPLSFLCFYLTHRNSFVPHPSYLSCRGEFFLFFDLPAFCLARFAAPARIFFCVTVELEPQMALVSLSLLHARVSCVVVSVPLYSLRQKPFSGPQFLLPQHSLLYLLSPAKQSFDPPLFLICSSRSPEHGQFSVLSGNACSFISLWIFSPSLEVHVFLLRPVSSSLLLMPFVGLGNLSPRLTNVLACTDFFCLFPIFGSLV